MKPALHRGPLTRLGDLSETRYWVYFLLFPSLILLLLVVAYPTLYGFVISVREMRLTRPGLNGWVGAKHYVAMMSDRVFWISLKNTAIWVAAAIAIEVTLGFIAAVALNRNVPGTKLFGVLILLPYFLPNVVAGHMWALLLDPRLGVINDLLVRSGVLSTYKAWFADPATALAATILVEAWHGFPFFALLFLAGLKGIPEDLYKAAAVDGAGPVRQFQLITVPMLKTVITAAVILRVISLVNSPDLLLVLTGGGPGNATQVLSLYAFQTAYREFNFGYAGALSVVMFVILMVFATLYIRFTRVSRE
ncbi:sugar ABC transporter permease [Rhizobium laguerreae]|uniref:carbohydrate ABC transporter permease n=1 Tax=Rhizobium TaxID=379 RepID=UPI000B8C8801|nr:MULTISPECIES: sugar ABC transporter permease [Rhizobium]ASR10647.1 ABC transporter permease [Rhizobium leguminosarum bv. viciae]MBY3307737.1 sugar ABC transporter permease [Rhizobium laguerreae]